MTHPILHVFYTIDLRHPWNKIQQRELELHVCRKTSWAIDRDWFGERQRFLIGASAFYTLKSAERAQIGALIRFKTGKSFTWIRSFKPDLVAHLQAKFPSIFQPKGNYVH